MVSFMVNRDVAGVFYLFVMIVCHWVFLGGAFVGAGIEAYFNLY